MLSHVHRGLPRMVDVGAKAVTDRRAVARCRVVLPGAVWRALEGSEIASPKGPVLATATVAGVAGAKRTAELIPFCHPVGLEDCRVSFEVEDSDLVVECAARTHGRTGIEMEALVGCSSAALCVYDMCKAISSDIRITDLRLVSKTGGKTDIGESMEEEGN